jgi:hypothetical protein
VPDTILFRVDDGNRPMTEFLKIFHRNQTDFRAVFD